MRRAVGVLGLGAVLLAGVAPPASASTRRVDATYCDVEYGAVPHGAGAGIDARLTLACQDGAWIEDVNADIALRDLSPNLATEGCRQTLPTAGGTVACSIVGRKLHSYLITYHFVANGSYAGCVDNTDCDPGQLPVQGECTLGTTGIVECTFREIVTVGLT